MNYYGAKELAESFRTVRKNTIVIAEEVDEKHYGFKPSPESRTFARIATHIVLAGRLPEHIHATAKLKTLEGFDFPGFFMPIMAEEQKPRTKAEIVAMLKEQGERFGNFLAGLNEDFLAERVSFPPPATPSSKTRFEMLLGTKEHEMHHRAQLMLIQRMVGVVPHLTREMNARIEAMMKQAATGKAS